MGCGALIGCGGCGLGCGGGCLGGGCGVGCKIFN